MTRLLVLDPAPGDLAVEEIEAYVARGYDVTVNAQRLAPAAAEQLAGIAGVGFVGIDVYEVGSLERFLREDGAGFDCIKLRFNVPVSGEILGWAAAPERIHRLRAIGQAGSGVNHIDRVTAKRLGVALISSPGSNADAVAEFVLGLVLASTRGIIVHDRGMHQGRWMKTPSDPVPRELSELVLGIVGVGRIGSSLASKAVLLGLEVLATGSERFTPAEAARIGVGHVGSLDELLPRCDVVSLNLPLTPATEFLLGERTLRLMKPGSLLVNTGRGRLVDEAALVRVLDAPGSGPDAAAVDSFAREGDCYDTPLRGHPRVILTAHYGGSTVRAQRRATTEVIAGFDAAFSAIDG